MATFKKPKLSLKQRTRRVAPIAPTSTTAAATPAAPRVDPPRPFTPPSPLARSLQKTPRALVDHVVALNKTLDTTFYQVGLALTELQRRDVYRAAGFRSFRHVLTTKDFPSRQQAYRAMLIVSELPAARAAEYGFDKSYIGIRYAQHVEPTLKPKAYLARNPFIRVGTKRIRFSDIKSSVLEEVLRALRRPRIPDRARREAHRVTRSFSQKLNHRSIDARVTSEQHGSKTIVCIKFELSQARAFDALLD